MKKFNSFEKYLTATWPTQNKHSKNHLWSTSL